MKIIAFVSSVVQILVVSALAILAMSSASANANPPSTPQLEFSIYSGTDAELFWTRSTGDSIDLLYVLERDGQVVYEGDGLSFYDTGLSGGQQYIYRLTVQDANGIVSDATSVGFDPNDRFLIGQQSVLPPSGLRADIYSSTALELFWDRVPGASLNYEIRQDASVVGITDGTSFYINSGVSDDQTYLFEVFAIRSDNPGIAYSDPTILFVDMENRSTSTERPLLPPQNVTLTRYSDTAAELFWDRAPAEQNIIETEVYRNGVRLVTTPGISFFDSSRTPGTSYTYELIAINNQREQSSAAVLIDESMLPATPSLVIDDTSLENITNNIARIVSGNVFNDLVTKAVAIGALNIDGLTFRSESERFPGATVTQTYQCDDAGLLTNSFPLSSGTQSNTIDLTDCSLAGDTFNGRVQYESSAFGTQVSMAQLERTYPSGDTTTISGALLEPGDQQIRSLQVFSYEEVNADGTQRPVNDFRTTSIDETGEARPGIASALSTAWTASGPFINDEVITATTQVEFDRQEGEMDYTRGTLLLQVSDLATIIWNAENGDPDSFQLTVEQENATNSYTVLWNDDNRLFLQADLP